jgi:hypothetical protein
MVIRWKMEREVSQVYASFSLGMPGFDRGWGLSFTIGTGG